MSWYIHHPMHASGLGVSCSHRAWQMAAPKFGVQMMYSEYCSKTGERLQLQHDGWGALISRPHYSGLVSSLLLPKQSNRVWFSIAIVIFKSGSDLGRASWKSWVWSRLESQPASSITGEIAGSGAKPFLSCFSNAFRIQLSADADYNHC